MVDFGATISAKSDQLNGDDLISGPVTITITKVSANQSTQQPRSIHFEGDHGKPYKPCLTMRRVLVHAWGKDGSKYVGRSMTLYREGTVRFGEDEVGGIRISHMSHVDSDFTIALTATRGRKKPYLVKLLRNAAPGKLPELTTSDYDNCQDLPALESLEEKRKAIWQSASKELKDKLKAAADAARARLTPPTTDNDREL